MRRTAGVWDLARELGHLTLLLAISSGLGWGLTHWKLLFSLMVTFAAVTYHIYMRTWVGLGVNAVMHNRAEYRSGWFRVSKGEERLYRLLGVNRWKNRVPTNAPENFDPRLHSWEEIAQTTCQSEVVHEWNLVLSFLPLAAAPLVGGFWAFLITGLLAAAAESLFIMIQRYNRARITRLIDRRNRKNRTNGLAEKGEHLK